MALKFERCLDAEVIKMLLLSDDYKKLVLLEEERYVEFHSQQGFYYKFRIPRHGRDLAYNETNCDLYASATGSDIYRFNLEAGQFMAPFSSACSSLTKLDLNPRNYLLACGSTVGVVETWDPRSRSVAGSVKVFDGTISALKFRHDGLTMAVGCDNGKVVLYDIRSPKPLLTKDHYNALPIKSVCFHSTPDLVLSLDSKAVKLWERNTGKPFTTIESQHELNGLCPVPETGLMFMPNEAKKIQTYYLPSLGPAPRWCSFLDNLTEELEESTANIVYDDYKFVTKNDLEELGLGHLIGSDLLRAYMHGFFVDRRLHDKAKSLTNPFAFEEYRKKRIREKMEEETQSRVRPPTELLPKVNKELAKKLIDADSGKLLADNRFGAMFQNPDFQIDEESEQYRLLNPFISQLDKKKKLRPETKTGVEAERKRLPIEEEDDGGDDSSEESTDDERELRKEIKKQFRAMKRRRSPTPPPLPEPVQEKAKVVKEVEDPNARKVVRTSNRKATLGDMLEQRKNEDHVRTSSTGTQEMSFKLKSRGGNRDAERALAKKQHLAERKSLRRPAVGIRGKSGV